MLIRPFAIMKFFLRILSLALLWSSILHADDWPHWLGPERDAVWRETGIVADFPEDGPEVLWRVAVSYGYSSPAVANGKVYVSDYEIEEGEIFNNPGSRAPLQGRERVHCLDLATGKVLWTHAYDRPYNLSYPGGPRSIPTIADGKVYHLGAEGNLICLDAENGEVVWSKDFQKEFEMESPIWGFAAHPLVHGDTVYCVAGGEGSVAVAFDKDTGEQKWSALTAVEPGYCPPTIIEKGGVEQLIIWHGEAINSLNPADGSVYWSLPLKPNYGMAIMAPRLEGNKLFASGIGKVAAVIELSESEPKAEILWKASPRDAVFCANSTPFIQDGVVYGCSVDDSQMIAASLENGERLWHSYKPTLNLDDKPDRRYKHGTAFITKHEESGKFYLFTETGDIVIADLTPEGYTEHARAHLLEPTAEAFGRPVVWAAPAFAEKSVIVRNDKEIIRVNLAAGE